ncbi:MAG: DUF1080 domain-containing protein [Chitinophagaceae bacterium]|nr:MAG: DUF1080 domain-containing protein [Chitinophagaceae bacterium]
MLKKSPLFIAILAVNIVCYAAASSQSPGHPITEYGIVQMENPDSPVNQLSSGQKADGWILLFNGKNMNGWRGYQHKSTSAWDVEDGILHCNGNKKGAAPTDLITDGQYANFILTIQWKISHAANSGIMFHVNEDYPYTFTSGPEYQIIDDKGWPGKLEPWQHTGCNYAMQVPDIDMTKPVGEWNTTKIVVNGPHVQHYLNGTLILQYDLWSPEWYKEKAKSKWKDDLAYGKFKTGHIALQYHGGDVWFRNIKLKVLPASDHDQ